MMDLVLAASPTIGGAPSSRRQAEAFDAIGPTSRICAPPLSTGTSIDWVSYVSSPNALSSLDRETVAIAVPLTRWDVRFDQLQSLERGWDGMGADAPNGVAIENGRRAVRAFIEAAANPDTVDPTVEDGVLVGLSTAIGRGNIECFNSGEVVAALVVGGKPRVWEVSSDGVGLSESVEEILRGLQT